MENCSKFFLLQKGKEKITFVSVFHETLVIEKGNVVVGYCTSDVIHLPAVLNISRCKAVVPKAKYKQ